jgi:hypothetical protein
VLLEGVDSREENHPSGCGWGERVLPEGVNPLEKGRSAGCEGKVFPEGVDPVKRAALPGVAGGGGGYLNG